MTETILKQLISEERFNYWKDKIPVNIREENTLNFSEHLLTQTEQEILDFYGEIINNTQQWSVIKYCGSVIILASHIEDLLNKLVQTRETDIEILTKVDKLKLHHLIIFCAEKYNIPENLFITMMKFKYFRNMVAHDFNSLLETGFHQAIHPICEAQVLIIHLVHMIRENE